jgi:ADP-ribose pyrophosphatase YjhB (NUDIX family)
MMASAVVLDAAGRHVLLVRDDERPRWRLVGSHVEGGEPLAEAARRAVREQTDLGRFRVLEPHLAVQQDRFVCGDVEVRHVDHIFAVVADPLTEVRTEAGRHTRAAWFPTDSLPHAVDPGVRLHLSQAVRAGAEA